MLPIQPQFRKKDVRSYVIRSGRITPSQEKALADQWPSYGLDMYQGCNALTSAFGNTLADLIIEIGFGMGDSLLEMARHNPEQNFIGIEVHPPGVGRIVNEASKQGLRNLRIFCADATDVLHDCIPADSLTRIQLFFPDPWHKARHHKRRIVQPPFIELVKSRLKCGGVFHMATDWLPYAESALELLESTPGLKNTAGKDNFSTRPQYRPETKFEKRGCNLGHEIRDLIFEKHETA